MQLKLSLRPSVFRIFFYHFPQSAYGSFYIPISIADIDPRPLRNLLKIPILSISCFCINAHPFIV